MKIVRNLLLLCILLICQQYMVAQSYDLGRQKQSFSYKSLYKHSVPKEMIVVENTKDYLLPRLGETLKRLIIFERTKKHTTFVF